MELEDEESVFIVKFESYEGPLEALLDLAKNQKIDLMSIDLIKLVVQFESLLIKMLKLKIELASDWLVMLTWLTYLKSKLLMKKEKIKKDVLEDEEVIAFRLKRLDYIKKATILLNNRRKLEIDWFRPNGNNENKYKNKEVVSLNELMNIYHNINNRINEEVKIVDPFKHFNVLKVSEAIDILETLLVKDDKWNNILDYIYYTDDMTRLKSEICSYTVAALELAKVGKGDIKQEDEYIYVKNKT